MSEHVPGRRLPRHPNLAQLRKQAKDLLDRYHANDPAALAEVHRFERSPAASPFTTRGLLARAYGFQSWPKLRKPSWMAPMSPVSTTRSRPGTSPPLAPSSNFDRNSSVWMPRKMTSIARYAVPSCAAIPPWTC